jgi:hypothetical protein
LIVQAILSGYAIGEISVPTKYFPAASSINLPRSIQYGLGVLATSVLGFLARTGIYTHHLFKNERLK